MVNLQEFYASYAWLPPSRKGDVVAAIGNIWKLTKTLRRTETHNKQGHGRLVLNFFLSSPCTTPKPENGLEHTKSKHYQLTPHLRWGTHVVATRQWRPVPARLRLERMRHEGQNQSKSERSNLNL